MNEEMVDVEFNLGKELADEIFSKKKKELIEMLVVTILRSYVQEEEIASLEGIEQNLTKQLEEGIVLRKKLTSELQEKLDKAEDYIEQGRAMVESVMERWHNYD